VPQQARAVAIMPDDLDQATAAAPKNVEITSVRIPLQTLLSQTRKTREHMITEHTVVRSGKLKRKPFKFKCGWPLPNYRDLWLQLPSRMLPDVGTLATVHFEAAGGRAKLNDEKVHILPDELIA
jgi:hypothetical protein